MFGNVMVLVVEDDADIRDALRTLLEEVGCEVSTANNGSEALDALHGRERPQLIVLDLMMPVMDGWTFLERRREDAGLASIPVVVTTAAHNATAGGVEAVLRKPYDLEDLAALVRRHSPQARAG